MKMVSQPFLLCLSFMKILQKSHLFMEFHVTIGIAKGSLTMDLRIKRVYEKTEESDGFRILTDRLWPRGISKEKAALDLWEKAIAPSPELRKWFGHEPEKFEEFRRKYRDELEENPETERLISLVKAELAKGPVTLLFGAKDKEHNQAVVLQEFLQEKGSAS